MITFSNWLVWVLVAAIVLVSLLVVSKIAHFWMRHSGKGAGGEDSKKGQHLSSALVALVLVVAFLFVLYFYFPGTWNVYWGDKTFFFGSLLAFAAIAVFWAASANPKLKTPARIISSIIIVVLLIAVVDRRWDFGSQTTLADPECKPGKITQQIPPETYGKWYIRIAKAGDSHTFTIPHSGGSGAWMPCGRTGGLSYTVSVLPRHTDTWNGPFKFYPGMKTRPDLGLYREVKLEVPDLPPGRVYTWLVSIGPYRGG